MPLDVTEGNLELLMTSASALRKLDNEGLHVKVDIFKKETNGDAFRALSVELLDTEGADP
jgi:hypothetical protein